MYFLKVQLAPSEVSRLFSKYTSSGLDHQLRNQNILHLSHRGLTQTHSLFILGIMIHLNMMYLNIYIKNHLCKLLILLNNLFSPPPPPPPHPHTRNTSGFVGLWSRGSVSEPSVDIVVVVFFSSIVIIICCCCYYYMLLLLILLLLLLLLLNRQGLETKSRINAVTYCVYI